MEAILTSVAKTTAPILFAVAIACKPATPAPTTNTFAAGIVQGKGSYEELPEIAIKKAEELAPLAKDRKHYAAQKEMLYGENAAINFAEKLGPVRATNFEKLFNVVSKPNPNDLAYTALELTSHSDNPYRKPAPGIQLLHCIANESTGGDSSLVDGFIDKPT